MCGYKIWRVFEKTMKNGLVKKFKVQSVTEDIYEDVVNFMVPYMAEEPFSVAAGVPNNFEYSEQTKKFWREFVLPQNVSLVCFEDQENQNTFMRPPIVGVNLLHKQFKGKEIDKDLREPQIICDLIAKVHRNIDIFAKHNVDEALIACGLFVDTNYRGMNIGAEIMAAREPMINEIGIRLIETMFTSTAAQKLGIKLGYEVIAEIKYQEMEEKFNLKFPESNKVLWLTIKYIE